MNTENLNELKYKAYHCAVAHGWHEEDLSNEHFLCLVISELMEAMEADRKGINAKRDNFEYYMKQRKRDDGEFMYVFRIDIKDSVEDELADTCIRLLDLAGLRQLELTYTNSLAIMSKMSFTEYIYCLCSFITNPDKSNSKWLDNHISYSLGWIFSWCRAKNIDIAWHIEQKMKYNELRPYMHGGKAY